MSRWNTVKGVVNERASKTRIEVTTGEAEEKSLKSALAKFSKKYGGVALSVVKRGSGKYGNTYGVSVDSKHQKGLQVVIAMALKNHKMTINGKSVYAQSR